MSTYIALDIGNVLVHTDFKPFLTKLSRQLDLTMEDASYFMSRTQKLHDLGYTVMTDELKDHFKIKSQVIIDELIDSWNNAIQPNHFVLDRLDDMKNKYGLKVALLSNVGLEHASRMSNILNHKEFFDEATKHFSCDVGARKPALIYYQSFLQLHPLWKGCLYIDDLQENLEASKQFGFRTHHFSLEQYPIQSDLEHQLDLVETVIAADHEVACKNSR